MPTFTKMNPGDVAVGRGRAAAEMRKPYIEALTADDAGSVELERGEKPATVKRLLQEAARQANRPHPLLVDGQPAAHAGVEEGRQALRHGAAPREAPRARSTVWPSVRNVSAVIPNFEAIDVIVAHCDGCSRSCSNTMRTARSRISAGYLPRRVIAPSPQRLEPPTFPGRFSAPRRKGKWTGWVRQAQALAPGLS